MTIFSDPSKTSKLEQIEDRALPDSIPVVTPGVVAASVGVAVFAASGSIVTVGCAVLPVLTYGVQNIRKWMKSKRFEREHGCIAHMIKTDRDMIAYIKIVGEKTVAAQLRLALEEGQALSSPAKKAANALLKPEELPHANVTAYLESTAPIDAEVVDKPKAISAQDEKAKSTTTGDTAIQKVTKDVVQAFVDDLRCTVLCAPPRTGKGIVAAGMMMGFKLTFPAGKLFSSTIKQFGDENWYFAESDAHINPNVKDPIALAKSLYHLYTAWESSESTADAPSLFVFDELRDTLLALKGVKCEDVSPDIESMEPKFDDWLRNQLISAATLNQCHRRYLLLISPTSTAQGMTFKDANSLQSYSSFTLVTPSELAFSEGNNGTFAAPAIRPDSPLFTDWYGLAWHSKTKQWFGVPSVPKEAISLRESQPVNLNYYKVQAFEDVFPAQMFDRLVKDAATLDRKIEGLGKAAVTKAPPKASPDLSACEVTDDDEFFVIFEEALQAVKDSDEPLKLTDLITSRRKRLKYADRLIVALDDVPEIDYSFKKMGSVTSHFFSWLGNEVDALSWKMLEEDN
jgi:hypothetical protein